MYKIFFMRIIRIVILIQVINFTFLNSSAKAQYELFNNARIKVISESKIDRRQFTNEEIICFPYGTDCSASSIFIDPLMMEHSTTPSIPYISFYKCSINENQKNKLKALEKEIKGLLNEEDFVYFIQNDFSNSCPMERLSYRQEVLKRLKIRIKG